MLSLSGVLSFLASILLSKTPFESGLVGFYYGSCQVYTNLNFKGVSKKTLILNMMVNGLLYGLIESYFNRIWLLMLIHLSYAIYRRHHGFKVSSYTIFCAYPAEMRIVRRNNGENVDSSDEESGEENSNGSANQSTDESSAELADESSDESSAEDPPVQQGGAFVALHARATAHPRCCHSSCSKMPQVEMVNVSTASNLINDDDLSNVQTQKEFVCLVCKSVLIEKVVRGPKFENPGLQKLRDSCKDPLYTCQKCGLDFLCSGDPSLGTIPADKETFLKINSESNS